MRKYLFIYVVKRKEDKVHIIETCNSNSSEHYPTRKAGIREWPPMLKFKPKQIILS